MDKKRFIKLGLQQAKRYKLAAGFMAAICSLCSCNDESGLGTDKLAAMQVSVQTEDRQLTSRGVIDGGALADGSVIGVTLTTADGGNYDGLSYFNLPYTASGEAGAQTWACGGDVIPSLSMTPGKAMAYYPYNADVTDLTNIPVETASQTDYMYSMPVENLSLFAPQANFSMKHALTDIRLVLVNESFTGDAALKSVKITSPFFGTAAKWDATTGTVSNVTGSGAELVPVIPDGTVITSEPLQLDIITIADESIASGNLDIILAVGSNQFTAKFPITTAFVNGNAYQYTLILNNSGITVEDAGVNDWTEEDIEENQDK